MSSRVFVTGATGFIGSHLVEALLKKNWQTTCLVRPTSQTRFLQKMPVPLIIGGVDQPGNLEKAVENQDYVFHLAARIRSASPKTYDSANHQLTRNLVQACIRKNPSLKRFVYVSSISAAGPSPPGCYSDENQPCAPTSEYGRSKLRGEEAIQEAWHLIPSTIIRPPNVYGPRQQETELLIKIINKRIVPLLRDKREMTSLIYVQDLVEGIIQSAISPHTVNQIYYLTHEKGCSWREIILTIKKHVLGNSVYLPFPEELIYLLAFLTDMLKVLGLVKTHFGRRAWRAMLKTPWLFTSSKAEKDFGFKARYSLEEGIKETVKCLSKHHMNKIPPE